MGLGSQIRAGAAYVEITTRNGALVKGLKSAQKSISGWGTSVRSAGLKVAGAGVAAVTGFLGFAKTFADAGSELVDMSQRTGMSVEALSELGYAADQSGADMETLEGGVKKMQKAIGDVAGGNKDTERSFDMLGISMEDLKGKTPDEQLTMFGEALSKIQDPLVKNNLAMDVFGKTGTKLLPMFEGGAAGMAALREEAKRLGLAWDTDTAKSAEAFGDAISTVWKLIKMVSISIGGALLPDMKQLAATVTEVTSNTIAWIKENQDFIRLVFRIAIGVAAAGAALLALGWVLTTIGAALATGVTIAGLFGTAVSVLGGLLAFVLSPIGLITTALIAGAAIWALYTQSGQAAVGGLTSLFGDLLSTFTQTFGGIKDALLAGDLALAGTIAVAGLRVALLQGVAALSEAVGGSFGDFLGTIGTQIAGGDLAGAWSTVVTGMANLWAGFAEGLVAVFTVAARAIIDMWQGIENKLTKFFLKYGNKRLLGVDMKAEQARAEKARQSGIDVTQREIATAKEDLAKAQANGGSFVDQNGQTATTQELERFLTGLEARLAQLQDEKPDVKGDATKTAEAITAATADALRGKLDNLDAAAQERTRAAGENFRNRTRGGADGANDALAKAQEELDAAVEAAKAARDAATEDRAKNAQNGAPDPNELDKLAKDKIDVSGTFNAAVVGGLGGGDVQAEIAANTKATATNTKKNNKPVHS